MPASVQDRVALTTLPRLLGVLLLVGVSAAALLVSCQGERSSEETPAPEREINRSILFNLGVEDETENRAPSDSFAVEVQGREVWYPDLAYGGDSETFGEFRVGEKHAFTIYPSGPDGPALEVPFSMKPTMSSLLASSKTYIDVYDDSLIVRGPAIPNRRASYPR